MMTSNPGVLPIELGEARLQRDTHTIVHYYNITPILEELKDLQGQHYRLKEAINSRPTIKREVENYNNIILHLRDSIDEKLASINLGEKTKRPKRSLYNEAGTFIKGFTGNLDAGDGERYDRILKDLTTNANNLQYQMNLQYTFNKESVRKFEDTVRKIEHNEIVLKARIDQLANITEGTVTMSQLIVTKELFNQIIILYSTLVSILQDIENSLTFCRMGIYHPSILKSNDLISILKHVSVNTKIPLNFYSLSEIQSLITVKCKIESNKIIYFLSFPVNYETLYKMYLLLSIPSFNNNGITTIIPKNRYFLRSNTTVKPLNSACELGNPFQCYQRNLDPKISNCELNTLLHENTSACQQTLLEITENYVQLIPEINQYLVVFPFKETLRFESEYQTEIKELQGIYLVELDRDNLIFRNEKINYELESHGKPIILSDISVVPNKTLISPHKIKLHNPRINDININQWEPQVLDVENSQIYWHVLSILTLAIVVCLSSYRIIMKLFQIFHLEKVCEPDKDIVLEKVNTVNPSQPKLYPEVTSIISSQGGI